MIQVYIKKLVGKLIYLIIIRIDISYAVKCHESIYACTSNRTPECNSSDFEISEGGPRTGYAICMLWTFKGRNFKDVD